MITVIHGMINRGLPMAPRRHLDFKGLSDDSKWGTCWVVYFKPSVCLSVCDSHGSISGAGKIKYVPPWSLFVQALVPALAVRSEA